MIAYFYTTNKKANSTRRPGGGTQHEIVLKKPTSVHNPRLQIKAPSFNYNYCYIPELATYYWLDGDCVSVANGLWEASFKTDLLATFKNNILSTAAYILYAAQNYDPYMPDARCQITPVVTAAASNDLYLNNISSTGSYILTCTNEDGGASGFCTTYLLTPTEFKKLVSEMLDPELNWDDLKKFVQKPIECITSCLWIPVALTNAFNFQTDGSGAVKLGKWASSAMGLKIGNASTEHGSGSLTIPWHYNDFRCMPPISNYKLFLPYYGLVDFNPAPFSRKTSVTVDYSYDVCTGDVTLQLRPAGDVSIPAATYNYNFAVNLPVASLTSNYGSIVSAIGSTLSSAAMFATGNVVGGTVGVIGTVNSALSAGLSTNASTKGSLQGRTFKDFSQAVRILNFYSETEDPDNYALVKGRPIMEYNVVSNFSGGFIQCQNASVQAPAALDEIEEINRYLNSGIYLE